MNDKATLKKELRELRHKVFECEGDELDRVSSRIEEIKGLLGEVWEWESKSLVNLRDSKRGDV